MIDTLKTEKVISKKKKKYNKLAATLKKYETSAELDAKIKEIEEEIEEKEKRLKKEMALYE